MSAPDQQELLPKAPLDLPRDLPKEIPAHLSHEHPGHHPSHVPPNHDQHVPISSVKTLLAWSSPDRPFREHGKEYFMNAFLITLLVEIILFFFSQYVLMTVVASLLFVNVVLKTVPPHDLRYRISTEGVTVGDHFYLWQELYDFYFKKREGIPTLHIRTQAYVPGELVITLGDITVEHIRTVLLPYLPYREVVQDTFMEKSANWLSNTFPLEKTSSRS